MDDEERITLHPDICHGKPVIKHTRIPVDLILGLIEDGADTDEILDMYPHLSKDDINACVRYARNLVERMTRVL